MRSDRPATMRSVLVGFSPVIGCFFTALLLREIINPLFGHDTPVRTMEYVYALLITAVVACAAFWLALRLSRRWGEAYLPHRSIIDVMSTTA